MIGLRRTYRDVARELSDGLSTGHIVLEKESTPDELGMFALLLFQHLAPRKVAFFGAGSSGLGMFRSHSQIMVQIDPNEFENLPKEVKANLVIRTQELASKGFKIKIKDLKGNAFYAME
jgi:hypothetical protein